MFAVNAIPVQVVEHDGRKMFLQRSSDVRDHERKATSSNFIDVDGGVLSSQIYIGKYGSVNPLNDREVDTPCILYRRGEFLSTSYLNYQFSQSDGFHVLEPFNIGDPMYLGTPRVLMLAKWFEVGDMIVFVVTPRQKKQ